ncbi:MAG: peptide MFS transporter [Alphaproteobacteria bacterium]|nr:peptide MFS transporter [Alphaproteobacteria bacterium]MBU2083918.1 peptide MFS transporter [Alphaproteobacteria bacterium]MBU2142929.1 peptide MFS transporter [Alphaproteobacteria bacterium]MBU2197209.1 peptide MFS transporter [Alphaproteobacteria bacterium]
MRNSGKLTGERCVTDNSIADGQDYDKTFLGHPRGLFVLFFTEMWERFSYYGMRALLVLYLTKHFLFDREAAYGLYGAYTTLVYITPVIGGYLADRYLGARKAVTIGAVFLVLGHLGMAIEGDPVAAGEVADAGILNIFYFSLALIIVGVGFLKANISTIVGSLYPKTDARRDSAFTIFYVGINTGAFLGALIAGYLGEVYGWAYGFGAAGIGMLLGLVVFVWGKPALRGAGEPTNPSQLTAKIIGPLSREHTIWAGALVTTVIVWFLVRSQGAVNLLLLASMIVTYLFIVWRAVAKLNPHQRNRIIVALVLISTNVLFWGLFEQAGSSLNLFTDEHVDRNLLGWEVPASMFQSINALYIMTLGPVFAGLWVWLSKKGWEPSAPMKFAIALMQLGLGFLVLVFGAAGDGLTPVIFIFLIYLLHTTGELCMSPVGLSAMTRLSVTSMVGLMMGAWFLASGAGNAVAALIAQATASGGEGVGQVLSVYSKVGWVAIGVGVLFALASPFLTKMMHLDTLAADDESDDQPTVDTFGSNTDPGVPGKTLG